MGAFYIYIYVPGFCLNEHNCINTNLKLSLWHLNNQMSSMIYLDHCFHINNTIHSMVFAGCVELGSAIYLFPGIVL